jgi:ribokinase
MTDVVVAGAINTDLVARLPRAPEAGETVTGSDFGIYGGGKGANQTLASVRSGASTAMLGAVGEDDLGRQRLADLIAESVDISAVLVRPNVASGVALITVEDATGQNRISYVPGATLTISRAEVSATLDRLRPRYFLTTLELPPDSIEAAIFAARKRGATVLLNATPEPAGASRFLRMIDVLIVNEVEASALLRDPQHDWLAAAEALRTTGPDWVIVTLGADGAVASFAGEHISIPTPDVTVRDSTGAGDALCGAFVAALAAGLAPVEALKRGVVAGSAACTVEGAQCSMPTTAQIDDLIAVSREVSQFET